MAIHQCPHCELWFMSGSGVEWHLLKIMEAECWTGSPVATPEPYSLARRQ
jgi:hypothetical protein